MNFIPLGWQKKNTKPKKAEIIHKKNIYYLGRFFRRNINIILDLKNNQIEKKWYFNKVIEKKTAKTFLTYNFFNIFTYTVHIRILCLYFFFKKKKNIYLKKNEIVIFGPFSWNYAHQIHEFLIRIIYLKNLYYKTIYLPSYLKKLILSKVYKKIFENKKFVFYEPTDTIKFINVNYISHIENRFINRQFKYTLCLIRDHVQKLNKRKRKKNEYIFISRSKSANRKLLNENILFKELSKIDFKLYYFEDMSIDAQIELAKNCKIMIGYHGAGISNCAYMNKDSLLIEVHSKFYPHPHFKLFCKALKIQYKSFICKTNYQNLDGICDVSQIVNFIKLKKNHFEFANQK
jgi:hypothetical protein